MSKQNYDIKTLQDYLAGKLDAAAMHSLERQALEDPLLAEALEGLAANPVLQPQDLNSGMDRLRARLESRVAAGAAVATETKAADGLISAGLTKSSVRESQSAVPVEPLYPKTGSRKWVGVAAIILVILAGGWFYFASQGGDKAASDHPSPSSEIASAVTKALTDSNNNTDTSRQDKALARLSEAEKKTEREKQSRSIPQVENAANDKSAEKKRLSRAPENMEPAAPVEKKAPVAARSSLPATIASRNLRGRRDAVSALGYTDTISAAANGLHNKNQLALGEVPGLRLMKGNSGNPKAARINIRGINTIIDSLDPGHNGRPLCIVDGIIVAGDSLASINPNSIAHIDVLKGTAASAIYGVKGENGVILITTKAFPERPGEKSSITAYNNKSKLLRNRKDLLQEKSLSKKLNGSVAGLELNALAPVPLPMQVHVRRLSGSLQPKGGHKALEDYLERQLVTGFNNKEVNLQDTGIVRVQVRMEDPAYGHGTILELEKSAHRPSFIKWLNGVLGRGPAWEQAPAGTLNRVGDGKSVRGHDNGSATFSIYFSKP